MKNFALLVGFGALAAASPAAAATNLVTNGGFETTSTTSSNGNFQLSSSNWYGSVTGWSTSGGYNLLYNASNAATAAGNALGDWTGTGREYLSSLPSGSTGKFLAIDGDSSFATAVTQTITGLVAGQTYTLSFDWAADSIASRTGAISDGLIASIGGQTFSTGEASVPSSTWNHASYTFTYGANTSNVLSFLSQGTPSGQPPVALLDNVSITAAVPEPVTWGMMIVGFGMVGAASRYRRRKTVAAIA